MTAEELAALVAEPEDLDTILERELERIAELRRFDDADWWGWE